MRKINVSNDNTALAYFKYLEEQERLEKEAKNILHDGSYYDKLISILKEKGFIGDDDGNAASKNEESVANYLSYLYDMIDAYAKKNYIYLSSENTDYSHTYHHCFYLVNYKDTFFTISKDRENGFDYYVYCSLCFQKHDNFIKIDEVLNDVEKENTKSIREKLEEFKEMIISYSQMGIPTAALEEASQEAITRIRKKGK